MTIELSTLARHLINENRLKQAAALNLSGANLLEIPDELAELSWLRSLSFCSHLNLHQEHSNTQLSDIKVLAQLRGLRLLDLSATRVQDLAPLAHLEELDTLHLSSTFVRDLNPLSGLTKLKTLFLSNTKITDLSALTSMRALEALNISKTQVTDLTPLRTLPVLRSLDISGSLVRDLSPMEPMIRRGCYVSLSENTLAPSILANDCPLTVPPAEIVEQGTEAVLNYFRERRAGSVDHLYEAKMLILGEARAGKTSLLRRLYQAERDLPVESETTRGIDIHRQEFILKNGRRFRLNVWDFGGQEIYHATHQFFLTRRSLYILVDDTLRDNKSVSDTGFKYWLELIDVFGNQSPVLIFQNEKSNKSKQIDLAGIKGRFDNVRECYAGNLESPGAATQLREAVEFFAANLPHIGEELPAAWVDIRDDLEERAESTPYITQREYFEIYSKHLPYDRSKALYLSRYLHDLGVFLHFQDDALLTRTVILQNEWATEAVFRILDDETVKTKRGRFSIDDCQRIWGTPQYADMHPELLALMQRFELCYALPDTQPRKWLAPQLLPPAKPEALTYLVGHDWLVLQYCYEFLPKGLLSRLIVRMNRFVQNADMAWVTGVLFQHETTIVSVEILPNGTDIELRAQGSLRKELLTVIASDLDALNDTFPGLVGKVNKRIPCNCSQCRLQVTPEFFFQRSLTKRKVDGRKIVECPRSYEDVDVGTLLDGVHIEAELLPRWAKLRTIRIFLASSQELRHDRDEFELYCRQQNDYFRTDSIYLEVFRWENFIDSMSRTRLQEEYNQAVRESDIFVCLFFTRVGQFTEEEFSNAFLQFQSTGRPRIYTYFKNAEVKTADIQEEDFQSLFRFKKKLGDLGHYHSVYDNIEHLKRQFRNQLDKLKHISLKEGLSSQDKAGSENHDRQPGKASSNNPMSS